MTKACRELPFLGCTELYPQTWLPGPSVCFNAACSGPHGHATHLTSLAGPPQLLIPEAGITLSLQKPLQLLATVKSYR